jgi:hypothetical protein
VQSLEARCLPSVGANINIDQPSMAWNQSNGTIAIDPNSPGNLFAAAETMAGVMLAAYSPDGGITWNASNLASVPLPHPEVPRPSAAFDRFGNLFLAYQDGGATTWCAFSFDDGATFVGAFAVVNNVFASRIAIATGPAPFGSGFPNQVVVTLSNNGNGVFAAAAPVQGPGLVGPFGPLSSLPGSSTGDYPSVAVGPVGQVLVAYESPWFTAGPSNIYVDSDPALLLALPFNPPVVVTTTNVGFYSLPAQPTGIDTEPRLAWDQSGIGSPPPDGAVYLVYTNSPFVGSSATDVFLQRSFDSGVTWTAPFPVPNDLGPRSKFNPAIAVDQTTGDFAITWLDCRNDLGGGPPDDTDGVPNTDAEVYGLESIGGAIQPDVKISAGPSNGPSSGSPSGLGNYDGVDFSNGVYYPIWADNNPYSPGLTPPNSNLPKLNMATAMVTPGPVPAGGHGSRQQLAPLTQVDPRAIDAVLTRAEAWLHAAVPTTEDAPLAATRRSPIEETLPGQVPVGQPGDPQQGLGSGSDSEMVPADAWGDWWTLAITPLPAPLS